MCKLHSLNNKVIATSLSTATDYIYISAYPDIFCQTRPLSLHPLCSQKIRRIHIKGAHSCRCRRIRHLHRALYALRYYNYRVDGIPSIALLTWCWCWCHAINCMLEKSSYNSHKVTHIPIPKLRLSFSINFDVWPLMINQNYGTIYSNCPTLLTSSNMILWSHFYLATNN